MISKKFLNSKTEWLRYGITVSIIYSLILVVLYITAFIPLPEVIGFLLAKFHEIFYFPQMDISSNILLKTGPYNTFDSWYNLFYLIQLIFTIIFGFIIGSLIGIIKSKYKK
ncbi:hypothetical protein HYT51_01495 [Candidatus Woesearchaeota archaeon]|nr:hypothetical protein [Candidatus Woesearchaeota archaeon]